MVQRYDVIIAGGGHSGLALAAALAACGGGAPSIAIFEPPRAPAPRWSQAIAIAGGSRRCLEAFGAWQELADRAEPIRAMAISDSRLDDVVRPVFLNFGDDVTAGEPLAYLVAYDDLGAALRHRVDALDITVIPSSITRFSASSGGIDVETAAAKSFRGDLLVAADGADSPLRAAARIATTGRDYRHSAIVATIGHERDHDGLAREMFLPGGPFASLPLTGRRSSIVWTEPTAEAARLIALRPESFMDELERRFGLEFGRLTLIDGPRAYPLRMQLARRFVAERFALLGDAAHVIHPLAGQGFNLGLRDVAALAEVIIDQARLGLDVGADDVLAAYQRMRRFDAAATTLFADSLDRLFAMPAMPARLARDLGLGLVDRSPWIKKALTREAAGLVAAAPKLLRGELI